MTAITLNENLNQQISVIAQQTLASVDEVVNNVLAKYLNDYVDEALEDAELLAIVKARENEPTIKVSLDDLLDEVAEFDLKTQFEIRAQHGAGKTQRGLELLEKAKFTQ
ncbi:hypothetical protein LBMAG43_01140 [Methylococcaceae bacterium]|nr:hypothetical protein LBMAG43_01140 [Methylococcaceae bacterium]